MEGTHRVRGAQQGAAPAPVRVAVAGVRICLWMGRGRSPGPPVACCWLQVLSGSPVAPGSRLAAGSASLAQRRPHPSASPAGLLPMLVVTAAPRRASPVTWRSLP